MEIIKWILIVSIVIFACFQIYALIQDIRKKVADKKNKINEQEVNKDDSSFN